MKTNQFFFHVLSFSSVSILLTQKHRHQKCGNVSAFYVPHLKMIWLLSYRYFSILQKQNILEISRVQNFKLDKLISTSSFAFFQVWILSADLWWLRRLKILCDKERRSWVRLSILSSSETGGAANMNKIYPRQWRRRHDLLALAAIALFTQSSRCLFAWSITNKMKITIDSFFWQTVPR